MQKLKRIKKWNSPQQHTFAGNTCKNINIKNDNYIDSRTSSKATTAILNTVILPNWLKMLPQVKCGNINSNSSSNNSKSNICNNIISNTSIIDNKNQHSRTMFATPSTSTSTTATLLSCSNSSSCRRRTSATANFANVSRIFMLPPWFLTFFIYLISINNFTTTNLVMGSNIYASTESLQRENASIAYDETTAKNNILQLQQDNITVATTLAQTTNETFHVNYQNSWKKNGSGGVGSQNDSIFMHFAKRFSTGNELWDGIIHDCYQHPTFSCFQKNVFTYLNEALDVSDVNITQRLKFYKNQIDYEMHAAETTTESAMAEDAATVAAAEEAAMKSQNNNTAGGNNEADDEHLLNNEIPHTARSAASETAPETPIEEVTTALYGKSLKFAMTHDIEMKLPDMMFDGATFRISPRSFEGNGIIAKLELIPKQEVEARLAGKFLMKKIQKFLKSKLLLSFLALVLIIKIIKIKLFWLLPIVIGVGAAKKLLLKFLLFLFPALSHIFKLCSYYQQTYHSTKYHHHHHLINHQHTVVPAWHSAEQQHNSPPELIYTQPPKGHISAYLHGAPIHETYGPPSHENYGGGWENSGPGLGTDYISDINRVAQIDENSNYFKPHTNDANELHVWGLGTTQSTIQQQQQKQQQRPPQQATQQQRPPPQHMRQQLQQQQQYHKPQTTSQNFNPFLNSDKQSIFKTKLKIPSPAQSQAQSAPNPVYTPPRNGAGGGGGGGGNVNHQTSRVPPPPHSHQQLQVPPPPYLSPEGIGGLTAAAQIATQYDPTRNNPQQQQQQQQQPQQLSPELSAQLKEAIRIQAEQRIVAQQQKILDNQPFVQDGGQPLMPKNYDPFYSPILVKIDKILEQLGVTDELCKERLVCSMYKDPTRYSPHSNFVSAELSRDINELQPVTNTNPAVVRFYRLIQAARDGQDQRDCLRLYPQCNINTE